jgi:hypothetical protein
MGTPLVESFPISRHRCSRGRSAPYLEKVRDGANQLPCTYLGSMASRRNIRNKQIGRDLEGLFEDFTQLPLRWIRRLSFLRAASVSNCGIRGLRPSLTTIHRRYVQDTRSSALFQYHVNGDDRLARQAIIAFAASISPGGVIEARFPSQGVQRITGFSLFWILQLFDHHMYFGDSKFTSKHLHIVDGILGFFDRHIGTNGLVQSHPHDHWAFVDWVTSWSDTGDCEPGTPLAGRKNGIFTYLSMLYAYALEKGSKLCQDLDRLDTAREYARRRESLLQAIKILCFDGEFFTDSLANDASASDDYSEHCQIWAVLCGATSDRLAQQKLLINSCIAPTRTFSQCSYAMKFYAMRAYSQAGIYDDIYHQMFSPWHKMLDQNLSTWEEDDVNARSDCHAWSALPIYEYLSEVSGLKPDEAGWRTMTFAPRIRLYSKMHIVVPLGDKGLAQVTWSTGQDGYIQIRLSLPSKMKVVVQLPDHDAEMHEAVSNLDLRWRET